MPQRADRWPATNQSSGTQPLIGARFDQTVARARLFVDGQEFTNQANRSDSSISWKPFYNLDAGQHVVRVSATGRNGQTLNEQWTFRVGSSGQATGHPHRPYDFGADATVQTVTVFIFTKAPGRSARFSASLLPFF